MLGRVARGSRRGKWSRGTSPVWRSLMMSGRGRVVAAFALGLFFAGAVVADTLELKDGRVLQGRYLGGTQAVLRFEINGDVKTFSVNDVVGVTFTGASGKLSAPVVAPPADAAPQATPPPAPVEAASPTTIAPPPAAAPGDTSAASAASPADASQPPVTSQDVPPPAAKPSPADRQSPAGSRGCARSSGAGSRYSIWRSDDSFGTSAFGPHD